MSTTWKAWAMACASISVLAGAGTAWADDAEVQEVVVTGQKTAEKKAVEAKHQSNRVEDALFANDVGKLPDQNVAESVRRLPGVSVANDQGEGRYVIIRGVNPKLANVTLNGQTAAAPEPESRQVKLDDIPSSLVGRVTVIKSLTADLDANAVAGQVDIETLSAFDRDGLFASARGAYGRYDLNGKHPYEADLTVGDTFGPENQFGAVVSANYSKRPISSENLQGSSNWTTVNGFVTPDDFRLRSYNLVRERKGVTGSFDWRPDAVSQLWLRGLYSEFSDAETRDQFRIEIPVGTSGALTNQTATGGSFTRGRGTRFVRRRTEKDNTLTVTAGGRTEALGGKLSGEVGYSRAEKDDPIRSEFAFRTGSSAFSATYDLSDVLFLVTPSAAAYDPAQYALNTVNYDRRKAVETLWQGRLDYTAPVAGLGDDSSVKVGAKVTDRHKTNDRGYLQYNGAAGFTLAAAGAALSSPLSIYDGRYPFGPRVDYDAAQAYATGAPGRLIFNASGSLGNSLVNDYDVSERISAGYAMLTFKRGRLTIIPGVRVEHTEGDYKGKSITATSTRDQDFNLSRSTSYTDWFPGVNARFDVSDRLVLRGAVTTAIGRPDYADLSPYVSVDAGAATVAMGNPDLQPLRSVSGDVSIEYYLGDEGVISLGLFHKEIDDPIYSQARTVVGQSFAGVAIPTALVTQPQNASKGKVSGVELNVRSALGFLPSPLDGFGVSANVTLTDSHAVGVFGREADKVPLFFQSDTVGSAQLFYEKAGFAARVAYSYRSRFLDTVGASAALDQYTDDFGQWDARISYQPLRGLTVFAEGANLNDEPWRRWIGNPRQLVENERYGKSVRIGLQFDY